MSNLIKTLKCLSKDYTANNNSRVIIFDFDGTLTSQCRNSWLDIWKELGYKITSKNNPCTRLFNLFLDKKISHKQWCELTVDYYINRNLTKAQVLTMANKIHMIDGFAETIQTLKSNGYSLHIVSGNFREIIETVLGDYKIYFDSINCNQFLYDENHNVNGIKTTNYDYEGKALFIEEFAEKYNYNVKNIWFIGNGANDEYAHRSNCNTICLNATDTNPNNRKIWHNSLTTNNLKSLLNIFDLELQEEPTIMENDNIKG